MALNTKLSDAAVNAEANALAVLLNSGYLRIYSGTQPVDGNTAPGGGNALLAELRFGSTAFGSAAAGVITANPITADPDAAASGTAAWFRCFKSDGTTPILDGSIGTSGCNINVAATSIVQHMNVSVPSFSHTVTK